MQGDKAVARQEWKTGWPAVCAGLVGAAATQIHFASLGVFMRPMTQSLGWSSSTITLGIFICALVSVPGTPFAGYLAQRFGVNRVVLFGMPCFLLAFASLGIFSHTRTQWIFGWILVALVSVFCKSNLWMLWVVQRFDSARGMAFALIMCGAGVLAIFVPYLAQVSIDNFGWRMTFPVLALAMAAIAVPICILGFRLCPAVPGDRILEVDKARIAPPGIMIRQAIRLRTFWQIGLISFLIGAGLISLQIHLVPMFQASGLPSRTAALVAGAFGAAALAGRLIGGAVLDRYSANVIGMISLLLPALGCLIFFFAPITLVSGVMITTLMGLGVGAEGDVLGYITSRHFGVRSFGTVFGALTGIFALGAGVGPLAISLLLEHLGSYSMVVLILFFALLLCAILFATLGSYPIFGDENDFPSAEAGRPDVGSTGALKGSSSLDIGGGSAQTV